MKKKYKYKVGMVFYGNDGYAYRISKPKSPGYICDQCIFSTDRTCHREEIIPSITSCGDVEGIFEHIKLKGGI